MAAPARSSATWYDAFVPVQTHPGYLGWTSKGVIAIHANWPAYAIEHGRAYSLERLGQFPGGTRFFGIGDIDQCLLLRVGPPHPGRDSFDARHFHVALWHEDVLDLFRNGLVEGVDEITPRQWASRRRDELTKLGMRLADGRPVSLPDPDNFDDDEATIAVVSQNGMKVTPQGFDSLQKILVDQKSATPVAISTRVDPLLRVQAYDAAVREACVILESHLRVCAASELFGAPLVEAFCARQDGRLLPSHVKWLRTELRACFAFVRNDFMHNLHELTEQQCLAIISRISSTYTHVAEVHRGATG